MAVVLGVDGGGTKTHAIVADDSGHVLGGAVDGPSNWEVVGLGGAGAALRVTVVEALGAAGLGSDAVEASVFGLAGLEGPREIVNDSFVAMRAGLSRSWGVVVIAGTGSVAAGRNPQGEVFRTLGLGTLYGDFGSANDVSVEAVRAVAAAYTGRGPATTLTERMCRHLDVSSAAEVLERVSRREHGGRVEDEVEESAPVVIAAANGGDLVARDILERAGSALGDTAALVAKTLGMTDLPFEIVLSGGLITGATRFVSDPLEVAVGKAAPKARFVHLEVPPAVGSALMAMELLGLEPQEEVRRRLGAEAVAVLWRKDA
jgi:N-acetylglucosamine kinase-like BadF-type ATPase